MSTHVEGNDKGQTYMLYVTLEVYVAVVSVDVDVMRNKEDAQECEGERGSSCVRA